MQTAIKKLSKAKRRLADKIRVETTRELMEVIAAVSAQVSFQKWVNELTGTSAGDLIRCPDSLIEHVRIDLKGRYNEMMSCAEST